MENLRPARIAKSPEKPPKRSFKPVPRHGKVTGSSPKLFRSKAGPECAPKWPDEGRPKRVWSLAEKCWTGVEISSLYVIHFEVVFKAGPQQVARKPPKSSSKPVQRHGQNALQSNRRPSRSSAKKLFQGRKWPEGRPKAAPRLFQVRPNALQKWYEPSERWVHAGPVQVPCGFILMFAPKILNCVSVSSFHFFDLKLRLRGPGMCFFVNLHL